MTLTKLRYGFVFGCFLSSVLYGFILFTNKGGFTNRLLIFFLIIFLQGLNFSIYAFIIKTIRSRFKNKTLAQILIALGWTVLEFISNKICYGFTLYISFTQYNNKYILPLVKHIGIYGISFLIILINIYIADIFLRYHNGKKEKYTKKLIFIPIVVILILLYGAVDQLFISKNKEILSELDISIIQGNISSYQYDIAKKDPVLMDEIFKKYMCISQEAINMYSNDIIIWPETAVHRWMFRLNKYRDQLYQFAEINNVYMIIGSPDLTENNLEYNSVFVISPEGKMLAKYDKNKLVPLWEADFVAGDQIEPITTDHFVAGFNICFEILFPDIAATFVRKGANILFVHSNNSMFGYTIVPYINSAFAVFRAAENNVYVIQGMNTGISQVIAPTGDIIAKTKLFEDKILNSKIPIYKINKTFYTNYGHRVYLLLTIFYLILIGYLSYKK